MSHTDERHYNYCIDKLETVEVLDKEDVYKTCAALHGVSGLQIFVSDFVKALLAIHVLFETVMTRDINIMYWLVAHGSALTFSFIGTFEQFQFSFDSSTKYDKFQVFVACACLIMLLPLALWNLMTKRVAKEHLLGFFAYYAGCYLLYWSSTKDIGYHLHHAFVCTFASYFYTDWSSKLNMYAHSILMGIAVQGLAFYKFDEYDMLNISNDIDVGGVQITIIYVFILTCFVYIRVNLRDDLDDSDDDSNVPDYEALACTGFLHTIEEGAEYE